MKHKLLIAFTAVTLLLANQRQFAAEPNDPAAELKDLVTRINVKLVAGTNTEAALAAEIKEFDALLAKHKEEKTDGVAHILYMKALLYSQVLGNSAKGLELLTQVKNDYPGTAFAQAAEQAMVQNSLAEGKPFPDFNEKDVAGKPLSIASYKGKVVLIDFWATWCVPCLGEVPNVVKAYEKYHSSGFEIIGISLDQDKERLTMVTRQRNMSWPQYFDGQGWGNKLVQRYGVTSIPATFLLDGEGKIIAKNLRGPALEEELAKVLASK